MGKGQSAKWQRMVYYNAYTIPILVTLHLIQKDKYDVSRIRPDSKMRYIEVKARAKTGEIAITPNEWLMAARLREEYWLYVVENAATNPQLYCIQNPKDTLKAIEEVEIVRFVVKKWKNKEEVIK